MEQNNITLKTLQKIKEQFDSGKALTQAYISKKTGVHNYAVKKGLEFLEKQGEIKKIDYSGIGILYIKNDA